MLPLRRGNSRAPQDEELPLAVALAGTQQGGSPSGVAVMQNTWWVDAVHGNNGNNGLTKPTAVASWAEIARRQKAASGGGRAVLNPTGGTVTYHLVGTTSTADPLCVVLDVDMANGSSALFIGEALPASHSGTLATASAFARTAAGGQIKITDAGVADWGPLVPNLFHDKISGAICWLALPNTGSSATGVLTPGYTATVPGDLTDPTPVTISGGETYELIPLAQAYMGNAFIARSFPNDLPPFTQFSFYRIRFTSAGVGDLSTAQFYGENNALFQECQFDLGQVWTGDTSNPFLVNCALVDTVSFSQVVSGSFVELFAGFEYRGIRCSNSGFLVLDGDNALYGPDAHSINIAGQAAFGNCSMWTTAGAGGESIAVISGSLTVAPQSQATAIVYGQAVGGCLVITISAVGLPSTPASVRYSDTGSGHAAADHFQFSAPLDFTMDRAAFGFNFSTGAFVGPTTTTFAHLDAALGAGTGFGGLAIDMLTGARIFQG
jgi:hypothetical protein